MGRSRSASVWRSSGSRAPTAGSGELGARDNSQPGASIFLFFFFFSNFLFPALNFQLQFFTFTSPSAVVVFETPFFSAATLCSAVSVLVLARSYSCCYCTPPQQHPQALRHAHSQWLSQTVSPGPRPRQSTPSVSIFGQSLMKHSNTWQATQLMNFNSSLIRQL